MTFKQSATHDEALEALGKKPEKEKPKRYISQKGWVKVPVFRGHTEIRRLRSLIQGTGAFILGGYVRYMCSPAKNVTPASDVDVYSPNQGVFDHLQKLFKEKSEEGLTGKTLIQPTAFSLDLKISILRWGTL